MNSPIQATAVNALIEAVTRVMKIIGERPHQLGRLELVSELPGAPVLTVSITVRGALQADICWSFDETVVKGLAERFFPGMDAAETAFGREDTLGEVANILLGAAMDTLKSAGFPVEMLPPEIVGGTHPGSTPLRGGALQVPLKLAEGYVRMVICPSGAWAA